MARFISYRYLVAFEAGLRTRKSKVTQILHKEESPIYHYASEDVRSARVCANLIVIMMKKRYLVVYCGPKQALTCNQYCHFGFFRFVKVHWK